MRPRQATRSTRQTALLIILACLMLALTACGDNGNGDGDGRSLTDLQESPDGDSGASTEVGTGDPNSFLQRADELCLATQRALSRAELEEFGKPGPDTVPPTRAERQRFVEEVVAPTWRGSTQSLMRIVPPESQLDAVDVWIQALIDGVRELLQPAAIIRDPEVESKALVPAEQAASQVGLKRCSETSVSVRDYASVYTP